MSNSHTKSETRMVETLVFQPFDLTTFEEAGVMTGNHGLVVTVEGQTFQVTVVCVS